MTTGLPLHSHRVMVVMAMTDAMEGPTGMVGGIRKTVTDVTEEAHRMIATDGCVPNRGANITVEEDVTIKRPRY